MQQCNREVNSYRYKIFFIPFLALFILGFFSVSDALSKGVEGSEKTPTAQIQEAYGKLPLYFIQNDGQVDEKVKFYEKGSGHATYFTKEGVYITLGRGEKSDDRSKKLENTAPSFEKGGQGGISSELIKLTFLYANPNPEIIAVDQQEGKVNYFIGNDSKKWKSNVPAYNAVVYKEVYPGIDIKFYGNNRLIEYDITVKAGADPSRVQFAYEGIDGLKVTEGGDLEIALKHGSIIQKKPVIYQEIDGKRAKVEGRFKIQETPVISVSQSADPEINSREMGNAKVDVNNIFTYTFEVAAYNREYPLIIDPVLYYSTYLGEYMHEFFSGIAVDNAGNCYLTGNTSSPNFPTTPGAYDTTFNGNANYGDAFILKINAISPALSYATYLGGTGDDWGSGIAVDGSGNAYVTGRTESTDFPTTSGSYDTTHNNVELFRPDVFIVKLDPTGSALSYATYLGGVTDDVGNSIAVDGSGNAYVTGETYGNGFPTTSGAYDATDEVGGYDAFVAKLNPTGSSLVYSTFLGGTGRDHLGSYVNNIGSDIAVDYYGNAYVTGYTNATNFPTTPGAYDTTHNNDDDFSDDDVFVVKLDSTGSSLSYATYLGGRGWDASYGIALDGAGNAYVTGSTNSDNFPTTSGAYHTTYIGYNDAFVVKLNSTGSSLSYATYLGGLEDDYGYDIALDSSGNAWITGSTDSMDFPITLDAIDSSSVDVYGLGPDEAFVAKLNTTGISLLYATYLGGIDWDEGSSIAVDRDGNIYVTGWTTSTDFPITLGAYDTDCWDCDQDWSEGFLTKLYFPNAVTVDSNNQQSPAVAFHDVDGEYLVLWQDFKNGSSNPDIYGDRLDQDGSVNVSKLPIVTNSAKQAGPAVAYGDGGYLAVWIDQRNSGTTGTDVYGAWITRTGTVQSEFVVTNATANQRAASVVYDPVTNYFLVTWIDDRNGASNIDIWGALVPPGAGSSTVIKPFAMVTATGNQRGPYVRYDHGNNQYFMVWFDNRNGNDDVYGSRVSSNGVLLDGSGLVITSASGNQKNPRITDRRPGDGVDYYVVAWVDFRNGSVPDVYGARVNSSGVKVGGDFVISGGSSDQRAISVDIDYLRTKNAMVTWTDNRNGALDIYSTQVNPGSGAVNGNFPLVETGGEDKRGPLVFYSADFGGVDNGYLLLWRQSNGVDQDIYNIKLWP